MSFEDKPRTTEEMVAEYIRSNPKAEYSPKEIAQALALEKEHRKVSRHYVSRLLKKLGKLALPPGRQPDTEKDTAVLRRLRRGKDVKDIAADLETTENAVSKRIQRLRDEGLEIPPLPMGALPKERPSRRGRHGPKPKNS